MEMKAIQVKLIEDGYFYVLARIYKKDASHNKVVVQQSDFTTIARAVNLLSDGSQVLASSNLTIANIILNALSTGTIWTKDTTGFNFIDLVPNTAIPTGDAEVSVEYTMTMTDGTVIKMPPIHAYPIAVTAS
jgi:hypothetical protein